MSKQNMKRSSSGETGESSLRPKRGRLTTSNLIMKPNNVETEVAGKIISIKLENFMCHSNLIVEFGSRVNFLVGKNGSGKSAILTALVVGLGSNARVTNRSTSLQKLIKIGSEFAKIEITLDNSGPTACQPVVFGEKIKVERIIKQTSNLILIKDVHGNVKSRKIDELRRILLHLNIQVDNPVFVLNQDTARDFLKDLEPKNNYQFFLKASQLDIYIDSINECQSLHRQFNDYLTNAKKQINKMKDSEKESMAKMQILESLGEMHTQLKNLEIKLRWCEFKNVDIQLKKIYTKIDTLEKGKVELSKTISNRDNVQKELNQRISRYDKEISDVQNIYIQQQSIVATVTKELCNLRGKISVLKFEQENCHRSILHTHQTIEDLQLHIQNYKFNIQKEKQLKDENKKKIEQLDIYIKEIDAINENARKDIRVYNDQKLTCTMKKDDAENEIQHLRQNLSVINGQITILKNNAQSKLSIFGPEIVELVHEIKVMEKKGFFDETPKGPLGYYIEVPNSKYHNVAEYIVAPVLRTFAVSTQKDRKLLNMLIESKCKNVRPQIVTRPFTKKVFDVSGGCVTPPKNTVLFMDVIVCKDPIVMNLLIDLVHIEEILITDSKDLAENLTSHCENLLPNLKRVVVPKYGLEYTVAPNYAMYSMKYGNSRFIQVNVEDRLQQFEAKKIDIMKKEQELSETVREIIQEISVYEKGIIEKNNLILEQENRRNQFNCNLNELREFEYSDGNDIDFLISESEEWKQKLRKKEIEKKEINEKLLELEFKKRETTIKHDNKLEMLSEMEEKKQKLAVDRDKENEKLHQLDHIMADNIRKLERVKSLLREIFVQRDQLLIKSEAAKTKAQDYGEYVEITENETKDYITEQIRELRSKIKEHSKRTINGAAIEKELNDLRSTIKNKEKNFEIVRNIIVHLHKSMSLRMSSINSHRNLATLNMNYLFRQILKLRNFEGELRANHNENTLHLVVKPNSGINNTRSLSGGERSFTTVAFLKALWATSYHPFYFLDEYDVFTDDVNREKITKLLIYQGELNPQYQYCFLTPQDTHIDPQDFIKIHRLADPQRN